MKPTFFAGCQLMVKIVIFLSLVSVMLPKQSSYAAGSWYVAPGGSDSYNCSDTSHPCATLQAAVDKAAINSGDTIYVAIGTYVGLSSHAVIYKDSLHNLKISGGWNNGFTLQSGMSTIDGQNTRRGVYLGGGTMTAVTIEKFIIENGYNDGSGNNGGIYGGAIYINGFSSDSLTINRSIIRNNSSRSGGAIGIEGGKVILNNTVISGNILMDNYGCNSIFTYGTLIMNNSTVSGNSGGNIAICMNSTGANAYINSSTIANNQGKGLVINGNLRIQNSILADNSDYDCFNGPMGSMTSLGFNLIESYLGCTIKAIDILGVDPDLGPLQDNGGPTFTEALLSGSPAINAGNPNGCMGSAGLLDTDQRGFPRYDRCDIGAFEVQRTIPVFLPFILKSP